MKHRFSFLTRFILTIGMLFLFGTPLLYGGTADVYLSDIVGLTSAQYLQVNQPISFKISGKYDGAFGAMGGIKNGFQLFSPNGAMWQVPTSSWDSSSQLFLAFDGLHEIFNFSLDGQLADTIGFGGFALSSGGAAGPFDEQIYSIATQFDSANSFNKTFCIDSSSFGSGNEWSWAFGNSPDIIPGWGSGPYAEYYVSGAGYCFTIGRSAELHIANVVGLDSAGAIPLDAPTTWVIGAHYTTDGNHLKMIIGSANGFKLYSPDGATWDSVSGVWVPGSRMYDAFAIGGRFVNTFGAGTVGADTIGFGGFTVNDGAMAPFDDNLFAITVWFSGIENWGKTFCIDSSFYRPGGAWEWGTLRTDVVYPDWGGGPYASRYALGEGYCFTISSGYRCGDINNDPSHQISILDLTTLVNYLFGPGTIPEPIARANVNCSGGSDTNVTILDLVYLVRYLFAGGLAPCAPCAH